MDDETKSLIFILFIISLIALSAYSALSSVPMGDFGGEFADLERAREDKPDKEKEGVSLITTCEVECFG